jgi:hypothetical protein
MEPTTADTLESRNLYTQLTPYQTRIIRLYSDYGAPELPLTCNLYTADILHPKFNGLGIRTPLSETDYMVQYDAPSYTWGSGETTRTILCNDIELPVGENLFRALQELRWSQEQDRYLWVDAICINQSDIKERGEQVQNMLQIYRLSTTVITWLDVSAGYLMSIQHRPC